MIINNLLILVPFPLLKTLFPNNQSSGDLEMNINRVYQTDNNNNINLAHSISTPNIISENEQIILSEKIEGYLLKALGNLFFLII